MAIYIGMTHTQIKDLAVTLCRKHGVIIEHAEAIGVFDEAMMKVGEDVLEADRIASVTWPVSNQVNLVTSGYMYPAHVFGDATELVYIPYENYRELFLGSATAKPDIDTNVYYTILGSVLYVEPDITDYTNLIIQYAPRFTTWATKAGISDVPELQPEYRMLTSYKICALLYPDIFEKKYQSMLNEKRSFKNTKLSTDHAVFWDPYESSDSARRGRTTNYEDES